MSPSEEMAGPSLNMLILAHHCAGQGWPGTMVPTDERGTMPEKVYRPRLTQSELFDLRVGIGYGIEESLERIETALGEGEVNVYLGQVAEFCRLYIKIRTLTGYHAAGQRHVRAWERRAEVARDRALKRLRP